MAVNLKGQIVDEQGNPTGGQVDLSTGQFTKPNITAPINTDALSNNNPITPTKPVTTPPYDVSGLTSSLSPIQTDIEKRIADIQQGQTDIAGKAAYTIEQQNVAGIPKIQQTQADLSTQLDMLKKEAASTRTQYEGALAQNKGTLEPFVTGERDALLRQNAVKALTISALYDATNNQLGSAQAKVERAVQEKYGPIEADLKAKLDNLDLILKSPRYTQNEKDRATAQAVILKKQEEQIALDKQNHEDVLKIATNAATNSNNFIPNGIYNSSALAVKAISQAKTPQEALQIATTTGLTNSNLTKQIQDTVFNLAQAYPDAGILPTDSLQIAQSKAAASPSFVSKQSMTRAVIDPNTGQITYYASKGPNQPTLGSGAITSPQQTITVIPPEIKPALENVLGIQYLDQGKLTTGQLPKANKIASTLGVPVLSKGDADEVQKAVATYNSAKSLMQTIIDKANTLITANNSFEIPGQYASLKAGAFFRSNSDAAVYQNTVQAFSSLLTRAAGEKGVLTNIDVQRIINALPNFTDTKEIAQKKIASLDSLFSGQVQGAVQAYVGNSQPKINLDQTSTNILNKYGIK